MDPRDLTYEHVVNVCALGQGVACCAFLTHGPTGWTCAKALPAIRATIRVRLAAGSMVAQGDNCSGPPDFRKGES